MGLCLSIINNKKEEKKLVIGNILKNDVLLRSSSFFDDPEYLNYAHIHHQEEIPKFIKSVKLFKNEYSYHKKNKKKAKIILKKFILEGKYQINISSETIEKIKLNINNPQRDIFDDALREIQKLGKTNYYIHI